MTSTRPGRAAEGCAQEAMALIEAEFEDTLVIMRRGGTAALAVAVQGGRALPHIRTAGHHPAEVAPTRTAVRDQLGIDTIVVGCARVVVADGVVRRVLVLESLEAGTDTTDLNWLPSPDARHLISVEPFDPAVLQGVFSASPRRPGPPDGRDWTVPGWWARATSWITQQIQAAGLGRVQRIDQIRAWEFSCVLRVHTDQQDLYFKAVPRTYAHEPRLARYLATAHPGLVPDVVAIDERKRWLLMRACRGQSLEDGASLSAWGRAAAGYADLQVASTAHAHRLQALGCRSRSPLELRACLGPLLADEPALQIPGEYGLSRAELSRLQHLRPSLEAACAELAESGLPLALEHGDLWSSNVFVSDTEVAFIDWTDASLAHPFFSLMPLLQSAAWDLDPTAVADTQVCLIALYLERWTPYAERERLRHALALARPLAALHIATTYWRAIPQPHAQWWMPRMVPFFVRMALEQWDAR